MKLRNSQLIALAIPIVKKYDEIIEYYKNPENERAYQEWYFERYGKYPDSEDKV